MLPTIFNNSSNQLPPDHHHSPKKTTASAATATTTALFKSQNALRLTAWLSITVLFQLLIIAFFARYYSSKAPSPQVQKQLLQQFQFQTPYKGNNNEDDGDRSCGFGKVFVYNLPPMFNRELLESSGVRVTFHFPEALEFSSKL